MAIAHVASLKDLEVARIQADELHAFVAAKDQNVGRMPKANEEAGTVWGYLAMCADTKLVFAYKLGDRTLPDARDFFDSVKSTLKTAKKGGFATKPTIVTDGLKAYTQAFNDVFGSDANFGMITKHYTKTDEAGDPTPSSRYTGATRKAILGPVPKAEIHTNYVERQNLNLRMQNRRYTRKTNGFSKTLENHKRHLALWIMYHNYCWIPRPTRPTQAERQAGLKDWHKRETAALAAGLTKELWTVEDLLDATDKFVAARPQTVDAAPEEAMAEPAPAPPVNDAGEVRDVVAPFWVYRSFRNGQQCKVHAAHCCNCRDGQGKQQGVQKSGDWLQFQSLEQAVTYASTIDPSFEVQCSMCLVGRYRGRVGIKEAQHGNPRSRR